MKKILGTILVLGSVGAGATATIDAQTNPYLDRGTHYELPITSDIPQDEKVLIAKDKAELTLSGWYGEYNIKITPQIPVATGTLQATDRPFVAAANRPLLSKKMEFKSGNVTAFIEPVSSTTNEFDIDFTLDAKPDTNVFEYKIEGAEQFDFFYQPALTPEEIAEGASQPDNVIGSYAVYHKTKANHRVGSTNYATGKALHIYRPKAFDANGAETWAELKYEYISDIGYLWVTVPQKFLDDAVYPVRVDPTFGHTSIGASSSGLDPDDADVYLATLTEGGSITSISAAMHSGAASGEAIKGLIYDNDGTSSRPATRKLVGSAVDVTTTNTTCGGAAWYSSFGVVNLAAGDWYLGVTTSSGEGICYDAGASNTSYYDGVFSYASPPDPFDATVTFDTDDKLSVYATYTASGGATADDTYFESIDD